MTTRQDLHTLIERISEEELDAAAAVLRLYVDDLPLPRSLGMGHSGQGNLSERVDEILAEGFGR